MTISPLQSDYVTKKEFGAFKTEVGDRFDAVDERLDGLKGDFHGLEKKFDSLKSGIAEQNKTDMAIWREHIQGDFKLATEILEGKIEAVETRINIKLDKKLDKTDFVEYMDDFKKDILEANKK